MEDELIKLHGLERVDAVTAYKAYLSTLTESEKLWMYLVNRGAVNPYYSYGNEFLSRHSLGIAWSEALKTECIMMARNWPRRLVGRKTGH